MVDEHVRLAGRNKYGAAVGACIYCGIVESASALLSDEHIVPYSLGADAILSRASCAECAKITSYLEGYAARQIFGPLRQYLKVQTRRKAIELGSLDVKFKTDAGERTQSINRSDLPPILLLPILEPAGKFLEKEPAPLSEMGGWTWGAAPVDESVKKFKQPGDRSYTVVHSVKADVFCRFIGKIAHTFAVARLGLGSFEAFLPSIILGTNPNVGFLIGACEPPRQATPLPAGVSTTSHTMALRAMQADTGPPILVVTVHLFPFTGAPSYNAIVGEPGAAALKDLEADGVTLIEG